MLGDLPPNSRVTCFDGFSGFFNDNLADRRRPRKRNLVHVRMLDQRRSDTFTKTSDNIHHTFWQTNLVKPLRNFEHGERSLRGQASAHRYSPQPTPEPVSTPPSSADNSRNDLPRHAHRLFQREAHRIVGHRIYIADDFRGEAAIVFETRRHVGDVILSLNNRLAQLRHSISASIGRFCLTFLQAGNSTRPRSCAVVVAHGPSSNAALAAATARLTSSAFPSGTWAMTSSVEGS